MNRTIQAEELTKWETSWRIANEIGRGLARWALKPARRDAKRVSQDYDAGLWASLLANKAWLRHDSLDAYLFDRGEHEIVANLGGRLMRLSSRDYYFYRTEKLRDALRTHAPSGEEIVELGCGYGQNIFLLRLLDRWPRFEGFDIAQSGIAAAREIAEKFGVTNVAFDILDLTDASHPNYSHVKDKVVYTYYCLEQLPQHTEVVLQNIRAMRARRIIHMEPTTELLNILYPMDLVSYLYVRSMDYQRTIVGVLRKMESARQARIIDIRRMRFAPTLRNDPVLLVWEPR